MAENCTKSAATFTLPEGEATDSNGSLQLPDDDHGLHNVDQGTRNFDQGTHNVTQTPSEVVDVDVDSERLQNRYVQTKSHLLQSTANDIGRLINDNLPPVKLHMQAIGLLAGEKYAFLKHHAVPSQSYVYPRSYLGGRNRSFRRSWLSEHPWMVYSEVLDLWSFLYSLCYFLFVVVTQGANIVVTQGGTWLWCKGGTWLWHKGETSLWCKGGGGGGNMHGCEARGNTRKEVSNPINENENHTIWLLKEVHHEKPNQILSEIIVIQVVLCTIIVPGLMKKEPPQFTTSLWA